MYRLIQAISQRLFVHKNTSHRIEQLRKRTGLRFLRNSGRLPDAVCKWMRFLIYRLRKGCFDMAIVNKLC